MCHHHHRTLSHDVMSNRIAREHRKPTRNYFQHTHIQYDMSRNTTLTPMSRSCRRSRAHWHRDAATAAPKSRLPPPLLRSHARYRSPSFTISGAQYSCIYPLLLTPLTFSLFHRAIPILFLFSAIFTLSSIFLHPK